MRVRLAGTGEAEDVARLIAGFRDTTASRCPTTQTIRAAVERLLEDPRTEFLLAGGPPAGSPSCASATRSGPASRTPGSRICSSTPRPAAAGVGRAWRKRALERARARGCRRIQLDANERNEPALALYRSLGFAPARPAALGRRPRPLR